MNPQDRRALVEYRISKAKVTLQEVDTLLRNEFWETSVNRIYYACYYAVIALLVQNEIKAHTHGGVRQMFGLHFVKTGLIEKDLGKFYSDIFDKRQSGDYDDFVTFSEDEVKSLLTPAKKLIHKIEELLTRV